MTTRPFRRPLKSALCALAAVAIAQLCLGCGARVGAHEPPAYCGPSEAGEVADEASPGDAADAADANVMTAGDAIDGEGPGVDAALEGATVDAPADGAREAEATTRDAPGDAPGDAPTDAPPDASPLLPEAANLPASCFDGLKDGDETDIDCGGSCAGCGPHGFCTRDSDCSATAPGCATAAGGCFCQFLSHECVPIHCSDYRLDVDETGIDCGGPVCIRCANGTACHLDRDCASQACDALTSICIADPCADHQLDGMESDVDCGGGTCPTCALGKTCNLNSDCKPGLACSSAHTCVL